jgi:hypothetical protein
VKKQEILDKIEAMRAELEAIDIEDAELVADAPEPERVEFSEGSAVEVADFEADDPKGELAGAIAALGSEQAQIRGRQEEIVDSLRALQTLMRTQGYKC